MKSETHMLQMKDLKNFTLPEGDKKKSLAILFCAPELFKQKEQLQEFIKRNSHVNLIGCSSSGEIFGNKLLDKSMALAHLHFDNVEIVTHRVSSIKKDDDFKKGQSIANFLNQQGNLKSLFVLSDGTSVNGSQLIAGINSKSSEDLVCTGGLAGDGERFEKTWVIDETGLHSESIVAAGFYGDSLIYGFGSYGGWDIFGPERIITKSEGNILQEIDGEPALDLYKKYLGHMAYKLPSIALQFPLRIQNNPDKEVYLVRTILSVNEEDKTLIFAGDIKQGSKAWLMRANFDRIIEGSAKSAQMATTMSEAKSPTLSIAISCVGRRLVLGERCEEEIEAALSVYPNCVGQIGFYSYGEISPTKFHSCSELLNQTMTITTIGEKYA